MVLRVKHVFVLSAVAVVRRRQVGLRAQLREAVCARGGHKEGQLLKQRVEESQPRHGCRLLAQRDVRMCIACTLLAYCQCPWRQRDAQQPRRRCWNSCLAETPAELAKRTNPAKVDRWIGKLYNPSRSYHAASSAGPGCYSTAGLAWRASSASLARGFFKGGAWALSACASRRSQQPPRCPRVAAVSKEALPWGMLCA